MRRTLAAAALAAAFVAAVLASVYAVRGHDAPLGFDTARYVWRNRCVAEHSLRGLRDVCRPPLATSMPSRIGYPSVTLPVASVLGMGPPAVAAAMPVAFAAALGLAAGGLVRSGAGASRPAICLTATVVGTSAMTVRMLGPEGYADNLLAAGFGMAALALGARARGDGGIGGGILLGAAGVTHWPTFAMFLGVGVVAAVAGLPAAVRSIRAGDGARRTEAWRWSIFTSVALVTWGVGAVLLGGGPDRFFADPSSSAAKLRADVSSYLLPVTVPLAAAGAWWLGRRREGDHRLEGVLVAWITVVAVAVAAWVLQPSLPDPLSRLGQGFPLHRFLVLALPLPILAGLAVAWLAELRLRRHLRAGLVVLAVLGWAAIGYRMAVGFEPFLARERVREAAVAARYLDRAVPPGTPVVLVVDGVGRNPFTDLYLLADTARIPLDPPRVADLRLFLGRPADLEEGRPSRTGDPVYDSAAAARWRAVAPVLDRPHVALLLRSFSPAFASEARLRPAAVAGDGVLVLEGPAPGRAARAGEAFAAVAAAGVLAWALGALGLLALLGLGWARASTRDPTVALFLSPAWGAAVLTLAGALGARLGIRPVGLVGAGLVLGSVAAGWALAALRGRLTLGSTAP